MSTLPDRSRDLFADAAQHWHLDRLYQDLATAKQNSLSVTEQICLRGLLQGVDPSIIAGKLYRQPQGLRVDLSRGLYRYIAVVTEQRIKNWREIPAFLEQAGYRIAVSSDPVPSSVAPLSTPQPSLRHNLPARDFATLVGRDHELNQLLSRLSYNSSLHCISIEGMGGVGKTTLALAAAYRCLELATPFDAIVFSSAKAHRLTSQGILPRFKPDRGLQDVIRSIAYTLQQPEVVLKDADEQVEWLQAALQQQSTLLIVDNLETMEHPEALFALLYDLSSRVKVVITSRNQTPYSSLSLQPLSNLAGNLLIQQQAQLKELQISQSDTEILCGYTNGIPAAIVYAVGQVAAGYSPQRIPTRLIHGNSDYVRFYFEESIMHIREDFSHQLLMALSLFAGSVSEDAIAFVVNTDSEWAVIDGLARLQQLSLVKQHRNRYRMSSLTRDYAMTELVAYPEFEQQIRDRWIDWYLNFVQHNGGKDWREWQDYSAFQEEWNNLHEAIEWCIAHDRYTEVRRFWQQVRCYTHSQGYQSNRLTQWNMRLDWTDWLIQAAEQRQDWTTMLEVMRDQGWTLTLLGQAKYLARAEALYQRAWDLRHHQDSDFQIELAINIAVLEIEQNLFDAAEHWLLQAETILAKSTIESTRSERPLVYLLYYQGEIYYKTKRYDSAEDCFQTVLEKAKSMNWQRAIYLAKDWLADIAIQQQDFDKAQHLLEEGLQVAKDYHDVCRAAFCKRSLARLARAQGDRSNSVQWAEQAKREFEALGMIVEAGETAALLQSTN